MLKADGHQGEDAAADPNPPSAPAEPEPAGPVRAFKLSGTLPHLPELAEGSNLR